MPHTRPSARSTSLALLTCLLAGPLAFVGACTSTTTGSATNEDLGGAGGQGGEGSGGDSSGGQGSGGQGSGGASSGGQGSGGSNTGGSNGTGGGTNSDDLSCVEGELELGTPTEVDTLSHDDSFTTSCGVGSSPEAAFEWTAPSTGYYAFDSSGSAFDTVVAVLDGDCDGDELACSNANGASPQGRAITRVEKDQRVVVLLDGNLGEKGDATLQVSPITCPATDVSDQPLPANLTTVGGTNTHGGACGGDDTPEKAVRYAAPAEGLYRFRVSSEVFSPALYVEQGAECGGPLLQCNTNVSTGHPAEVTRWLEQGEAVTLIVDGGEGAFTLDAQKLEDPGYCPSLPQLDSVSDVVIDENSPALLSPSCEWAGNLNFDDTLHSYPEHAYTFTVDLGPADNCTVSVVGDSSFVATLLQGDHCEGAELECKDPEVSHAFSFTRSDNGVYTLVIENSNAFGGALTYSISTSC